MRKLLILLCLIFLTGCSVNYEITLKNNIIKEKLTIIETDQSLFDVRNDSGWTLRELFETLVNEQGDEFSIQDYSIKSLNSDKQLGLEYRSKAANNLLNSAVINQCYDKPINNIDDNIITFSSGEEFRCYEYYDNLDTINIVLKTNYKVISSNADLVDNNKYIWKITKDGPKNIEIKYEQTDSKSSILTVIIFIVGLVIVSCIVAYYLHKKYKQENKI